jgi:16S rRNA (cytosine1402-N4)-methyltransferase
MNEAATTPEFEPDSEQQFSHVPVLYREVVEQLNLKSGGLYLDLTLGGGGHSRLILEANPEVRLVGVDQDEMAIAAATAQLECFGDRAIIRKNNFATFKPGKYRFDGILADLGVSSAQFDIAERGFSFRNTAPLDMRMDQSQSLDAAEIVNTWDEAELADIFYKYGEERLSRRIARQIVEQRPFETTTGLAYTVAGCFPAAARRGRIHPATRVFQALRIAVNRELEVLETLLDKAPLWLNPGGRLAIISFHSLEDRIVKHRLRESEWLTVITKKPILPQDDEVEENIRSRSAKLRVAERKLDDQLCQSAPGY